MKLSNYIMDLGRVIAYYPNLKKITGSTTSSILLCQLIYWCDKTKKEDGWIWKTAEEIEDETGLTENEQRTAKRSLEELGLIDYEFKRLSHSSRFRVNHEGINKAWEEKGGAKCAPLPPRKKRVKKTVEEEVIFSPLDGVLNETSVEAIEEAVSTPPVKKGDLVDGFLYYNQFSPGAIKQTKMNEIHTKLRSKLHVNTDSAKWTAFVEFAYTRQENHKEPFDKFMDWLVNQPNFDPVYWSPERMKSFHPQAYIVDKTADNFDADLIDPSLKYVEKEYEKTMPKFVGKKQDEDI